MGPRLAAFLAALRYWWSCRPWAIPERDATAPTDVERGRTTPAIMPAHATARLGQLVPASTVEALVLQLEEHRRDARSGEIVVRFHCDRLGLCGEGRVQPAEIVGRAQVRYDSRLTAARPTQ